MTITVPLLRGAGLSRVLVTGASGAVGPAVVLALRESGLSVRAWVRRPDVSPAFPHDVAVVTGDLFDEHAVSRAVDGVDAIVHLAAELHQAEVPDHARDRYRSVNVEATRQLVAAATAGNRVRKFVFLSTTSVYGPTSTMPLTEETPPRPVSLYGQTKLEAEQSVLSACDQDGAHVGVVLRSAAVYGPRIKGNYRRLVRALARHRFVPIGPGQNRRALVHVDDLAHAIVLALRHEASYGRVYNVSDGGPHTLSEIIACVCAALGRTPPRVVAPIEPVLMLAAVVQMFATAVGLQSPLTPETIAKYTEDLVVSNERIRHELAFHPRVSLADGWRSVVDAMRAAGELS